MTSRNVNYTAPEELPVVLLDRVSDLIILINAYGPNERQTNWGTLQHVMPLIAARRPLADWDPKAAGKLIMMINRLGAEAKGKTDAPAPGMSTSRVDMDIWADLVCSMAAVIESNEAKEQACELWLNRHPPEMTDVDLNAYLDSTVAALRRVGLPEDRLTSQVKATTISLFVEPAGPASADEACSEILRKWLADLVALGPLSLSALDVAKSLGIEIQSGEARHVEVPQRTESQDTKLARSSPPEPTLWKFPKTFPAEKLQTEIHDCLVALGSLPATPYSPITPRNRQSARTCSMAWDGKRGPSTLYFAGTELWRFFATSGIADHLLLTQRVSWLAFECAAPQVDRGRHKKNAFYLWMATGLPDLIGICDLKRIVNSAHKLCSSQGYYFEERRFWTSIIQAHAGVCRGLQTRGDSESVDNLLRANHESLRQMHHDNRDKTRNLPPDRAADEQNAWDYLLALFPEEQLNEEPSSESILRDPSLDEMLRHGSPTGVFEFIKSNLQLLKDKLHARLKVRFSTKDLLPPEGRIFSRNPQERNQMHPTFEVAVGAMERNDLSRAESLFRRLGDEQEGMGREICRNYQAYSLARLGELADARRLLKSLVDSRFKYPSAYWNYACCSPPDQTELQLKVLCEGLDCTPHPLLLRGVVSHALFREDHAILKRWLTCLALAEALLLAFYFDYEQMDAEARDEAIVRLNSYRKNGEPYQPDPTADALPLKTIESFMNDLLDRKQPAVFQFWLNCRPPRARKSVNYWVCKADFLQRTGQRQEALEAFRNEVRARVARLEHIQRRDLYMETQQRADQWLNQSMTPQLRECGGDIFTMLQEFDKSHPDSRWRVTPERKKFKQFFDRGEKDLIKQTGVIPVLNGAKPAATITTAIPTALPAVTSTLETVLARVGGECYQRFRDVKSISQVRTSLAELERAFTSANHLKASDSLTNLVSAWDACLIPASDEIRRSLIERCKIALGIFEEAIRQELSAPQQNVAVQLLNVFRHVHRSISRSFGFLPTLTAKPVEGEVITLDNAAGTSFAVRVVSSPSSPSVRLTGGAAALDDEQTRFRIRDKLSELPQFVSPERGAILTFETDRPLQLSGQRSVRVDLTYEFAGESVTAKPTNVTLSPMPCPSLPEESPFIYNRKIEKQEIKGHFFGRELEQKEILNAVSDGQRPKLRYLEGIRRSGKSSLMESVRYEISRLSLPLVPVSWNVSSSGLMDHIGKVIFDLLDTICKEAEIERLELVPPDEARCCTNPLQEFRKFVEEVGRRLSDRRLVILLDDLHVLVSTAETCRDSNPGLSRGIVGFLNLIWESARPGAVMSWVLAGQRTKGYYQSLPLDVLLWTALRELQIDFLDESTVAAVLRGALEESSVLVPDETVEWVHRLSAGYPEVVQMLGEAMFNKARSDRRSILTPSDAQDAAEKVASWHSFDGTWYPRGELSAYQKYLLAEFVRTVPVGGRIEAFRLARGKQVTSELNEAIKDLVGRHVVDLGDDGLIGIQAHILDIWLHREILKEKPAEHGSSSIFVDVANLTAGSGSPVVRLPDGKVVQLADVLDRIEDYALSKSPIPPYPRWVINYPKGCSAVLVCSAKEYQVQNIPDAIYWKASREKKGADDIVLQQKISEVEQDYPNLRHFIIVTGDTDYSLAVDRLLQHGKHVHILGWERSVSHDYSILSERHTLLLTVTHLENLFVK